MKHWSTMKYTALLLLLALCLSLTSCYIPPDEITDGTNGLNQNDSLPWQTIAPTVTVTPSPSPTAYVPMVTSAPAYPQQDGGVNVYPVSTPTWQAIPTINWNDDWGTGSQGSGVVSITPTPAPYDTTAPVQQGATPTPSPYNSGVAVITATPYNPPTYTPSTKTDAPSSGALQKGDSGSSVKKLQQRLKDLGYYRGSVDGDFGAATETAVKAFQRAHGLTADGKVGSKTSAILYSGNAITYSANSRDEKPKRTNTPAPKKTATPASKRTATPTPKRTATPKPTATPNLSNARYLSQGYSGSDVKRLQQRLIDLGWLGGKADGDYGGATEAAVKAFQKKAGLWDDGVAGPDTQARLYAANAPHSNTPASSVGESLREGMNGQQVRSLQKQLKKLGYYGGTVDGDYGAGTTSAVRAFQQANGLKADGVAGTATLNALYSSSAMTSSGKPASGSSSSGTTSNGSSSGPVKTAVPIVTATPKRSTTATPKPVTTPKPTATPRATATPNLTKARYLTIGFSGSDVKRLQQRLIDLGWMSGKADGNYGGATQAAVRAFQKKTGIWDDGIAGPGTQQLLYSANAARASAPASSNGESLRPGMSGNAVKALQKRLKTLGYYSGTADGSYGDGTTAAVRAFQQANGLTADGIAGSATLNAIYESDNTVTSGSSAETVIQKQENQNGNSGSSSSGNNASGGTTQAVITSTGYTVLKQGDRSNDVSKLQSRLKELGYYNGSIDGHLGSGTVSAIKNFQTMNGLRSDGIAGPATQRLLYGTSTTQSYNTLRVADTGNAVSNLQYTLYELGYYDGTIDGFYGDTTSDAVRAFQIANALTPVDGVAGNKTLRRLYSSGAVSAQDARDTYKTMRRGDRGENVVEMQDELKKLGYLAEITGTYDKATENAVEAFQRQNGIEADGVAGAITQKLLYEGHPLKAPN